MQPNSGTYALIMQSSLNTTVQIGKWGKLVIHPGFYIYVGSAFGPGGVKARVLRHCRVAKSKHWHIDYLRDFVIPVCAWFSYSSEHFEHQWAQVFSDMVNVSPVKGFGCSDCACYSHLFKFDKQPNYVQFTNIVSCKVESWSY